MLTSVMLYLKPEQKTLQLELGFLRSCEQRFADFGHLYGIESIL